MRKEICSQQPMQLSSSWLEDVSTCNQLINTKNLTKKKDNSTRWNMTISASHLEILYNSSSWMLGLSGSSRLQMSQWWLMRGIRHSVDNDDQQDFFLKPGQCQVQWEYVGAAGACIDGGHGMRVIHSMFGLPAGAAIFSRSCSLLRLMSAGCFPWSLCQATGLKIPREPKPIDGRLWSR